MPNEINSEAVCVWPADAQLGEGPTWVASEGAIYWLDIKKGAIHRLHLETGERRSWSSSRTVSSLVRRRAGGFLAATRDGFGFLELDTDAFDCIAEPERDRPGNRMNDGKCDGAGRFWAGSMDDGEAEISGALYRLDPDRAVARVDDGYGITNGPAFSPDGKTLYHTSTLDRTVYAFDLAGDGTLSGKRVFVQIPEDAGYPDGMTTDKEGGLWVAHFAGHRLTRFLPDGSIERVVQMPVANVTSCAFGGPALDMLFVTTARKGLSEEDLERQPLAGGLFRIDVGIQGLPAGEFAG
jgi:xylono-1,5-lactonase